MKIISFSVRNFRSITDARKIDFKDYTVLIGKNNEGKSNLLKALSTCMSIINQPKEAQMILRRSSRFFRNEFYDWDRDFPIVFQNRKNGLKTIFKLEFLLSEQELKEFKKITKTRINSRDLTLQIEIGPNNKMDIKLPKKGTHSLTNKANDVLNYISSKITYNYIPARRQETDTVHMIERSISREFSLMEENEEYRNALSTIKRLQTEKLRKISDQVQPLLKEFIPSVRDIKIEFNEEYNYNRIMGREISIMIDDGTLTNIEYKGDGIKSLMALAILKNRTNNDTMSIIAIDEPEAHLHPGAMNELAKTLKKLSEENQVIISTHSHLFMNKENIRNNVIVDSGKAKSAKNIHEIRELLGIKMSDNLMNSEYILLVEGESDKTILTKVLCFLSETIKKCINNGTFSIFSVGGASKIEYNLNIFNSQFCKCYVFADNDEEGIKAVNKAIENNQIERKKTSLCFCNGMKESEIEDCFNKELYEKEIKDRYGVNIDVKEFKNDKKWSDRMKNVFNGQGQFWNDKIERDVKMLVASAINEKFSEQLLIKEKSSALKYLVEKMEENIKNKE